MLFTHIGLMAAVIIHFVIEPFVPSAHDWVNVNHSNAKEVDGSVGDRPTDDVQSPITGGETYDTK